MVIKITQKLYNRMSQLVPKQQLDAAKVYLLAKNKDGVLCDMMYLRRTALHSCYAMSHISTRVLHTAYNRFIKRNLFPYGLCRINKYVSYGSQGGWDGDGGSAIHSVPIMISVSKYTTSNLIIENNAFKRILYEVV